MCKGLIYDILNSPLPVYYSLRDHISMKSLKACSPELVNYFYRMLKDIKLADSFFRKPVNLFNNCEDVGLLNYEFDEFIWNKFHMIYPQRIEELKYIHNVCIDYNIAHRTVAKEQLIHEFIMYILRMMLISIPDIHKDHIKKMHHINQPSLGPVPFWKINIVRAKAGLPILDPPKEEDDDTLLSHRLNIKIC